MIATLLSLSGLSVYFLFCVLFERLRQRFDNSEERKSMGDIESFKTFTSDYESDNSTMAMDEKETARKLLLTR